MSIEQEREELARLEEEAKREAAAIAEETAALVKTEAKIEEQRELIVEHTPFHIHVNNKPVEVVSHEHTGLQIKEAAKRAGVRIELDFVLSEELSHGRSRIIGDDQRIKVDRESCFEAIPNDDHS